MNLLSHAYLFLVVGEMATESRRHLSDSRSCGEGNSPGPLDPGEPGDHHEKIPHRDPGDPSNPGDPGDPGDQGDTRPPQNGLKAGFVEIPIDDNGDSDGESGR